jgi:hypothetical protein
MRRPPEVGQVGLLVILMLGASGCAGFPQRSTGTSPWSAPADGQSASPPGLFSWWHHGSSQNTALETASARQADTAGPGPRDALANEGETSPWPETQAEWMARNFPRFNRIWNGSTTGPARAAADRGDDLSTSRTRSRQPVTDTSVTDAAPRSDRAVQPTDGSSGDDTGSNANRPRPGVKKTDDLPFSRTPPPVRSPRPSTAEPVSDQSPANDERPVPIPSDLTESAEPARSQPKANPTTEPQETPQEIEPDSSVDRTSARPQELDDILPAPALGGPQKPVNSDPGTQAADASPSATESSPVGAPQPAPQPAPEPTPDTRVAQAPPAAEQTKPAPPPPPAQQTAPAPPPPPTQRTAPAPAPAEGTQPASTPPEPPAPPAATPAEGAKPAAPAPAETPAQTSPAPATSVPAPASGQAQAPAFAAGQRPLAASGQSPYTSPSHATQPQPRHHLLSWLFHDDATPLASAQLPTVAFPTSYASPQSVAATTGQGKTPACDTAEKAPKKPCFLKVWIHDWKSGHGANGDGCAQGGNCASVQASVAARETAKTPKKPCVLKGLLHDVTHGDACGNGVATASPQSQSACETGAKAPKKPCFLKVWIHDWKNAHNSGCGCCQKGGGSCGQSGQCCGGGGSPVAASAQGSVAAAQATGQPSARR